MTDTEEQPSPLHSLDSLPPLLKVSRVAKMLDVTSRTVERMVEDGHFESFKLTRSSRSHLRITTASLIAYLKASLKK